MKIALVQSEHIYGTQEFDILQILDKGQSIHAASSAGLLLTADDGKQNLSEHPDQDNPRGGRFQPKRTASEEWEIVEDVAPPPRPHASATPRTRVCRRSCKSNCACDAGGEVLWNGQNRPVTQVRVSEGKIEGISRGESSGLHEPTAHEAGMARGMDSLLGTGGALSSMRKEAVQSILRIVANECGAMNAEQVQSFMAAVSLCEVDEADQILVNSELAWEDVEFEVALDSGSVVHVCARTDTPGYDLQPSPGSRRGQQFMMGDGGKVDNQGQVALNLSNGGPSSVNHSVFQAANVTRPLMSVGRICDEGFHVDFQKEYAVVSRQKWARGIEV